MSQYLRRWAGRKTVRAGLDQAKRAAGSRFVLGILFSLTLLSPGTAHAHSGLEFLVIAVPVYLFHCLVFAAYKLIERTKPRSRLASVLVFLCAAVMGYIFSLSSSILGPALLRLLPVLALLWLMYFAYLKALRLQKTSGVVFLFLSFFAISFSIPL